MPKSNEIKKELKKHFPTIKFSVTYKYPYGYRVKWKDGISEGATSEAVKAIADKWDEQRNISQDDDPIFIGDSVRYNHEITNLEWKQFVIDFVSAHACQGVKYNSEWNEFRNENNRVAYHEQKEYEQSLHNGIKSDLEDSESIWQKEDYYNNLEEKDSEKLPVKTKSDPYQENIQKLYKIWVEDLIRKDEVTNIVCFDIWKRDYLQTDLENRYKFYVLLAIETNIITDIESFDSWLERNYKQD